MAAANNVLKVQPNDFKQACDDLKKIKQTLDGYQTTLSNTYTEAEKDWDGQIATAFGTHAAALLKSYSGMTKKLEGLYTDLENYSQNMQNVDQKLAAAMGTK